ncbi:stomatin [Rhodovibrio sodomensis]|uniref:Stomatin n=1 Tax=Rhodovibrio sodomensis TaxID=1088 RepID=A0ABS1DIQ4_9PROT|nr:SPFH domain-containing protein [Rhodovibrio sodomensis]MBK1670079.1 stomatin [Rhodovibrio sodomensis]
MTAGLILAAILAVLTLAFIYKGFMIVEESQAVVIERLGSYNRTLEPGVNFIIPVIDKPRPIKIYRYERGFGEKELTRRMVSEAKIDKRESVLNFPAQPVVTNDNVSVQIDGALYFQIEQPDRAVYAVENLVQAVETLAKTTLRSVVGGMQLDELFSSRDNVNTNLQAVMDEAGDKWGVKVNRVELQDISVPSDVEDSMHQQMAAERSRRAQVTEANGKKEAAVREAEGDKESAILRAEGERSAIEQVLSAGKEAGTEIGASKVMEYMIAQRYIDMLPNIAKDGERILVPYEGTAMLGSIQGMQGLMPGFAAVQSSENGAPAPAPNGSASPQGGPWGS